MEEQRFNIVFAVVFTQESESEFNSFDKLIQKILMKAIVSRLTVDPIAYGKPLVNSLKGLRRMRVSKYRVIYAVDFAESVVTIYKVGIRKNVYG